MRISKRKVLLTGLVALVALSLTVGVAMADSGVDDLFNRIRTVYNVVSVWDKDGADPQKFVDGAIRGGLAALGDPYTNYFTPKEYTDFLNSLSGNFSGIGAYLETDGNYIVISAPIKDSPAAKAGLLSGDRILQADDTPLLGESTDKAVQVIRGPAGSTVTLKIERPSESRTFTVQVVRQVINIPQVDSKMLEPQVGYIQISSFGDTAANDFYKAANTLKAEGAKTLVLDLRENGGGYLDAAVSIASAFIPKGEPVLWEVTKDGKSSINSNGTLINLPVVVLVDHGSASASEILSGALQDYGIAPLVGTKTFGKGTVQQLLTLSDGSGAMKVTIAEYLTAKEHHVHGISLTPDYALDNPVPSQERVSHMESTRMLANASVGLDVLYLQYRLQDLGYDPDVDGFFGIKTAAAVKRFEVDNWLTANPVVGQDFIDKLNEKVDEHTKSLQLDDLQLKKAVELAKAKIK